MKVCTYKGSARTVLYEQSFLCQRSRIMSPRYFLLMFAVPAVYFQPCVAADSCPAIPLIQHADTTVSDGPPYKEGTTVEIECDKGYKGYGTPVVKCLEDGRWSDSFPDCRALLCSRDESQIESGRKCRKRCKTDGDCQGKFKRCECDDWCGYSCFNPDANCPDLKDPENGFILGTKFSYGYKVTYGCNDGFMLSGDSARNCRSDRTWSGYEPKCLPLSVCGISGAKKSNSIQGNVIGGNDTNEAAWPWQALLFHSGNHKVAQIYNHHRSFGGGSVINNKWILTAAHVFDDFLKKPGNIIWKENFLIVLGMTRYPKEYHVIPDHVHIFEPHQVYRHKEYKRIIFDFDVALIRIGKRLKRNGETFIVDSNAPDRLMEFSRHIRPVCLPCMKSDPTSGTSDILKDFNSEQCSSRVQKVTNFGDKVVVTGFGYQTDPRWNFQDKPTVLQKGLVEIQHDNTCINGVRRMPDKNARYTNRMICTESANKGLHTDACQGDSGGPLVKQFQTSGQLTYWMQVGIVSWGYGCSRDFPGYYTSVSTIMSWVRDTIKTSEAYFTEWSTWSKCSTTCGAGRSRRTRRCVGEIGSCEGDRFQTMTCNVNVICPMWSDWIVIGVCSATCGSGLQRRSRICRFARDQNSCTGLRSDTVACNTSPCPSSFSDWSIWSRCSTTCGAGESSRTRRCLGGIGNCVGDRVERVACNENSICPEWSNWSLTGFCSVTCGGGLRRRSRICRVGSCNGQTTDTVTCNTSPCSFPQCRRVDSQVEEGRRCRKSCKSDRDCRGSNKKCHCDDWCGFSCFNIESACPVLNPPENGYILGTKFTYGQNVTYVCDGGFLLSGHHTRKCRSDKTWSGKEPQCLRASRHHVVSPDSFTEWTTWSRCSGETCAGKRTRTRQCRNAGGCVGEEVQTTTCDQTGPCAGWRMWENWTPCSASCGGGYRQRIRACGAVNPRQSGCVGHSSSSEQCNTEICSGWTLWSRWFACSVTCGKGIQERVRRCIHNVSARVVGCGPGNDKEKRSCDVKPCL